MAPSSSSSSRVLFGQAMKKKTSRYQRQFGKSNNNNKKDNSDSKSNINNRLIEEAKQRRNWRQEQGDKLDEQFGIETFTAEAIKNGTTNTSFHYDNSNNNSNPKERRGWIFNMLPTTKLVANTLSSSGGAGGDDDAAERSGLDLYFWTETAGESFKSTILYRPYFYLVPDLTNIPHCEYDTTLEMIVSTLLRMYDKSIYQVKIIYKLDLDQPNHLSPNGIGSGSSRDNNTKNDGGGSRRPLLQLLFDNVSQLMDVRALISKQILQNTTSSSSNNNTMDYTSITTQQFMDINDTNNSMTTTAKENRNPLEFIKEMREYDVPYLVRVCTDLEIRAGTWYTVKLQDDDDDVDNEYPDNHRNYDDKENENHHHHQHHNHHVDIVNDDSKHGNTAPNDDDDDDNNNNNNSNQHVQVNQGELITLSDPNVERKANPKFLAYDIECTKAPLKFPNAEVDEIFMISYMVSSDDGPPQGYLIVSKTVVSRDILDFEYTPLPKYPGPFHIFNERDEQALIRRFFAEYKKHKPQIVVTYNGDFFDFPFLEQRAKHHGIDMYQEIGLSKTSDGEYRGHNSVHLDAFHWVQRDSYLPQGAQGLKAVTKYKLGYDPVEIDPEDMVQMAKDSPVTMASYSVSDAVATYYLYEKYVHLFIFSLCTIIPMGPEDILRKGSGTLCECLLMVEACTKHIICPNKQKDPLTKFHNGHLVESETYIGGKVECLETGVYRSDIQYDFDLVPEAFQQLMDNIDRDLTFAIEVEGGLHRKDVQNYDEVRCKIIEALELLRDRPVRTEKPYIYHLDVGAMYPNIILTNRLQPSAIVNDAVCATCDFNHSRFGCKRHMEWIWRGDYNPASYNEYEHIKDQLQNETVLTKNKDDDGLGEGGGEQGEEMVKKSFRSLSEAEQATTVSNRLKKYSNMAYKKTKVTKEEFRNDIVCMRENDFYVETVRRFRDRRYELKKLTKVWKKKSSKAKDIRSQKDAEDRTLVYDSLQVAHKCILNSFYGYVMRKGARWRSMEMAGIVTKTGSDIITQARKLVEQIGRPLELDTDGIWCILPKSFPDIYTLKFKDGSTMKLEYPCIMLNADVHDKFTNHQYQTIKDPVRGTYETRSECSIFFEVDGPYRCMVIPASTEEGKLLKKRYAVFNFDGSLAELKGFELKRRGELELIKTFQSQVFERFLDGKTLKECYDSVADVANYWIDIIDTKGESLDDDELVELISENRNMSRQLSDYGDQKGVSQTTARRLSEFLGAEIVKDKGLNCKFIIAEQPYGAPVTERAIPTAIWKTESMAITKHYLRKWLKAPGLDEDGFDIRNVLDWDYYLDRLGKNIQKIITIPAALQKISNPVPRIKHPDWLCSKVNQLNDPFKQKNIRDMFKKLETSKKTIGDIEDIGGNNNGSKKRPIVRRARRSRSAVSTSAEAVDENISTKSNNNKDTNKSSEEIIEEKEPRVYLSKENFGVWLKQKKSLWRQSRRERKRLEFSGDRGNRTNGGGIGASGTLSRFGTVGNDKKRKTAVTMAGFVREAAKTLTESEWHIIEVREMSSYENSGTSSAGAGSSSGEFVVWAMVGSGALQKIHIVVPRTVYVSARAEITNISTDIKHFKRVDKHLPDCKGSEFVYEISMPEYIYRSKNWMDGLKPVNSRKNGASGGTGEKEKNDILESIYETGTPLMVRALTELGCVAQVKPSHSGSSGQSSGKKGPKTFSLSDLCRVDRPREGEYLHSQLSYKKIFLYIRVHSKTRTGIVALFVMKGGSDDEEPSASSSLDVGAICHLWVVKPGSSRAQKSVSKKQCESTFSLLLGTIQESAGDDSEYARVSPMSSCQFSSLNFVDREDIAYSGVNDVIKGLSRLNQGPSFVFLNSNKPTLQIRRYITTFTSFPVVPMPFPPGPAHNPSLMTLPSLNWEQPAVQLSFEAYLYMAVVSCPKRVSCARYGYLPIGNLGEDENVAIFDISLSRLILKNRALSWASPVSGCPDLGTSILSSSDGNLFSSIETMGGPLSNQDEIWFDDDELISPVVRSPGCYRTICVDIDVHGLAIAALSDQAISSMMPAVPGASSAGLPAGANVGSPTSVTAPLQPAFNEYASQVIGPVGDEMSTSIPLPIVRSLIMAWLQDAFSQNSVVADELLHHTYRLISNTETLMHHPALHRVIHSLMKGTFLRLLNELKRLGCTIVFANFHKVTVATNKTVLADAEEYIEFIISTIRSRCGTAEVNATADPGLSSSLARVSLHPRQFHSHFLFLDEYNFGTMHLERCSKEDVNDDEYIIDDENENSASVVVPSVVTAWSIMNFLGSEIAQEYFRVIIGRFSKDILKKQMDLSLTQRHSTNRLPLTLKEIDQQILGYKRKVISKHFASYLTRAVGEIIKDGADDGIAPPFLGQYSRPTSPALEFIKNVVVVLDLDSDVQNEIHILKRSLLAQVGVAEYSQVAQWINPCPTFIVPDIFCSECNESRDVNLCYVPPPDGEDTDRQRLWSCESCGTVYDVTDIERRLINIAHRKMLRYQLQDIRCQKTNRVVTRSLPKLAECSTGLKLDISPRDAEAELNLLYSLADSHELETLQETIEGFLGSF